MKTVQISENRQEVLKLELTRLQIKALKMIPFSPRQMRVRADIDRVWSEIEKLSREL